MYIVIQYITLDRVRQLNHVTLIEKSISVGNNIVDNHKHVLYLALGSSMWDWSWFQLSDFDISKMVFDVGLTLATYFFRQPFFNHWFAKFCFAFKDFHP